MGRVEHRVPPQNLDAEQGVLGSIMLDSEAFATVEGLLIAEQFYGNEQPHAVNLLYGDPLIESPNTSWSFDPERANQILDEAGWVLDGNIRSKDGVELSGVLASSVNPVRQKTQAVVKANLEAIGMQIEILAIDSAIFFDTAVGNDQNYAHFYWDMNLLQSVPNSPRSMQSMETWYAGEDRENLAQRSNGWAGQNTSRYVSEDYDAAFDAARSATDAEELAAQTDDADLAEAMKPVAEELRTNEETIINELNEVQGQKVSIGGYYYPDRDKTSKVMRPAATLNSILDKMVG